MAFTDEQLKAITENGNNILVSAGAGSGKTTVLSERVLRKVIDGVNVDEILILTFTKAAASSMKKKIREKLIEANLTEQVNLLDKAYITTFDSLLESIVKRYHDRLNLDKNIKIIDANSIGLFKKKTLDKIFDKYYQEKNELFIKLITDFCLKNDKEIKPLILSLNDKLDLKYDKREYLEKYIDNYYSEEFVNKCLDEFNSLLFNNINIIKENLKYLETSLDTDDALVFDNLLDGLVKAKTYGDIKNSLDIKLPVFNSKKYTDEDKCAKKSIDNSIKELKELCIVEEEKLVSDYLYTKDYLKVIIDIILELDKEILDFKLKHNTFEFIDISKLAIKLVKENKDIKDELTNSFNEIMIDEYQDTSDLQEEFISEIANNNTYMVGDIKQSIYRFRNANPDIFKEKYLDYEKDNSKGIKIDLNKNFRSREEDLIDINTIFDRVMDIEYGGANYKDSHRMVFGNSDYVLKGKTDQNYSLELYNYLIDKDSNYNNYDKCELEAFIIARDIQNKVNNKYKIYDKKNKVLREIRYSDFSIIVDRSKSFDTYKKIFEYLKVPLTVFKKENIAESIELYLIRNILRLIDLREKNEINSDFEYSFVSISRSYLFEYNDEKIYDIVKGKKYLDDEIIKRVDNIVKKLPYLDLKNLIIEIKEEFNFLEKFILVGNIDIRIATFEYFINLASDLSNIDYDYHMFIEYLDSIIKDSQAKIEIPISIASSNSASIMTIHASKGLEYPICYFPEMGNEFNMQDIRSKIIYDNKYGITMPSLIDGYNDTFIKILAKRKFVREEVSEKIRLFYVALTRVEEKMIVITNLEEDKDTKEKEKYRSFIDIIRSIKDSINTKIKNIDLDDFNISKDYLSMIESKLGDYPYQELNIKEYYNEEIEKIEESHFSKTVNKLITKEEKNNMIFGTRIHELFEIIDFKKLEFDKLEITDNEKKYITNFLNQELLKNVNNANILKEYEFYYEDNNEIKHGIIDLMLEYDDHIDIIDYKLKHINDELYLEQLNGYKKYIENKTKKCVNIYLYSILDNEIKKI